jgi:chitodextrinase
MGRWTVRRGTRARRAHRLRRALVLVAMALLVGGLLVAPPLAGEAVAAGTATYVQGAAFTTGSRAVSTSVTVGGAVGAGDLLVGWFAQYNTAGQVQVSDDVNGGWTRAPGATAFRSGTGDIALYYLPNSKAAPGGLHVTASAGAAAYFQGSIGEYSGVAVAGPLDQVVSNRGVGTAVDTGTVTGPAGELVLSALVTGGSPTSTTAGPGYTARARTGTGSAFSEDILASVAGTQRGTATLGTSTDWYAVAATFRAATATTDTQPPTTPANLHATSVAATNVSLAWNAATDNVAVTGYTVYRNGAAVGTTASSTLTYTDTAAAPNTTYGYTVDAFDGAGNHSPPSPAATVTTPARSPAFVQGAADSPGARSTTATITLTAPVAQGDLLVGWFAQYDAPGQIQVSDTVNGAWTRSPASEHFTNGGGDLALFYVLNSKGAPGGTTITLSASSATYLPSAAAEFSGVAATSALDVTAVGRGVGTSADSSATAPAPAGELIVGGLITGNQPLTVTPGSSNGVPLALVVNNGSKSADIAAGLASAAGPQDASFTLAKSMDWYAVVATFRAGP